MKFIIFISLLLTIVSSVRCQEALLEDEASNALAPVSESSSVEERSEKEKRGIALNLGGTGMEGYSYFGPSSRGLYRGGYAGSGYTPMTDYGYDGVNYGVGSQNFAGGYQGYGGGFNNMAQGSYPYGYRGGYPTSYSNFRLYNQPINTYPLGGIGTVGPYGGGAGAIGGGAYGFNNGYGNRFGGGGGMEGGFQPGLY